MPIKALNTFTKDWVIKARISSKTELKQTRKGGWLLKMEIVDELGTSIEGTFFNDSAKHWDPLIEQNKVYLFRNGKVSMANKKFTTVRNDFCITFEQHAVISQANDDGKIGQQAFEFVPIADLEDSHLKNADILAVIVSTTDADSIKLKSGESKLKKEVILADQSGCSIKMTIWGD
jgi:replication factor A1